MNVSVERLRVWLLVGAVLLAVVIAGFLGYAHYVSHRFLAGLPEKLGADIQRETNAFTYSQSVEGKTIYTIHAAKAIQRTDGKVTLRDVGIVLYGRKQDRADRIYGSEFEYDQNAGVIRAMGEVHIDLEAPMPGDARSKVAYASGRDIKDSEEDERLIHVKTSGLVFLQKLGVAATDQPLAFRYKGMTGSAVGADYSSDTGLLTLQSVVRVNGVERGQPVLLTANRAELNRQSQVALLTDAKYVVVGGAAQGRTAQSAKVTIHLHPDGSVERLEGEDGVELTTSDGGKVTAQRGEAVLDAQNQLRSAKLAGAVRYSVAGALRESHGEAERGAATFDDKGRLTRVLLEDGVHVHERVRAEGAGKDDWGDRDLVGKTLELTLDTGDSKKTVLREAKASGDARLTVVSAPERSAKAKGDSGGRSTSVFSGDVLTAEFVMKKGKSELQVVHGFGHTVLSRVSETGDEEVSRGDSLDASFAGGNGAKTGKSSVAGGAGEVVSAVQQGHVVITDRPGSKTGKPAGVGQRATAEKAVYVRDTDAVTLTGAVQVTDGDSTVWADQVVMEHESGDATADGSVKANYQPGGAQTGSGAEPTHVLASRAVMRHATGVATFYAGAGKLARLWQGASQVEAPVLVFDQKKRTMEARGASETNGPGAALPVRAVFVNGVTERSKKAEVVRVASKELTYSDGERRADFTGGVVVENADGTMRGQQATIYLQAAHSGSDGKGAGEGAFLGGSVERIVASGRIEIDQPGRKATGTQVVYTAGDGMFVLTGTPAAPPKVMDETRGTVTGAMLRFHTGDNSVVVSSGADSTGQRVHTETRVKQ